MKIRLDYVTPDYSSSPGETETLGIRSTIKKYRFIFWIKEKYIDKQ